MRRASFAVDAAFFAMIVLVPLAWTNRFVPEFTLAKFLVLNAALCLAAWGAALSQGSLAGGAVEFDAPLLAGLFVAAVSAAASDDPWTSLRGRYDSYAYGLWGMALLAAVVELSARGARGREERLTDWMIGSAAFVGGYGVLQKFGVDPIFHLKTLPAGGRAVSTLGSPVDLGALLALTWPLALHRLDAARRPLPAVAVALIAGGLFATGSRGAWLAAGVGAAAYWLTSRRRPEESLKPSLALAAAAAWAAMAWSFRSGAPGGDIGRREVWKTALTAFFHRPLLGWGPDGFEDAFRLLRTTDFTAAMGAAHHQAYAHNDLLQVLAGLGLAGAAVYAALLCLLARSARRALAPEVSRPFAAALTAGLLAVWVNLEVNTVSLEVLLFSAIAAGLLYSTTAAPSEPAPRRPLFAAAALASYALFCAFGLAVTDAVFKLGLRAQATGDFATARKLIGQARDSAPCELAYPLGEANAVGDWINATHVVDERLALLARADEDGRLALTCHPRQVNAHYIAGATARMHADLGFKDHLFLAAREFDAALQLDPLFPPLQDARLQVARLQGDAKRAAELERLLAPPPAR